MVYNIPAMTLKIRNIKLIMNQELIIAYDSLLDDLSFTLSIASIFKGKDDLDEDERCSDENIESVYSMHSILSPILRESKPNSPSFFQAVRSSEVIEEELLEKINEVLAYKDEKKTIALSVFDPYSDDLDECIREFYQELLLVLRLRFILKDIAEGIQEYGVEPYKVPDNNMQERNKFPFEEIESLTDDKLKEEVNHLLELPIHDWEEEKDDRTSLITLSIALERIKGGK